jgi:hypothetical protein
MSCPNELVGHSISVFAPWSELQPFASSWDEAATACDSYDEMYSSRSKFSTSNPLESISRSIFVEKNLCKDVGKFSCI